MVSLCHALIRQRRDGSLGEAFEHRRIYEHFKPLAMSPLLCQERMDPLLNAFHIGTHCDRCNDVQEVG
jgi:hypothetical protein